MKSASVAFVAGAMALIVYSSQDAVAQWSSDPAVGVVVCSAPVHQQYPHIVSDNVGGAIIGWWDERNGNKDIYAQRINASGYTQWMTNGIPISTAANDEYGPVVVSDGSNGAILVWQNVRSGIDWDIFAQRVNPSGEIQWGTEGVAVVVAPNIQEYPTVISDGSGGAIIAWEGWRDGEISVYAQKINGMGVAQWTANGVRMSTSTFSQRFPTIASDGSGGAIITWYDNRVDGRAFDIYAQKINSSGVVQWGPDGVAICSATGDQYDPVIISDVSGGAIVTWYDHRDTTGTQVYAQKVNASGVAQWITDGVRISSGAGDHTNPIILSDESGGAIISWNRTFNGTFSLYAQKIDNMGVVQWTTGGVAVSTSTGVGKPTPAIASDGSRGAIITWPTYLNGINDLYAQTLLSH